MRVFVRVCLRACLREFLRVCVRKREKGVGMGWGETSRHAFMYATSFGFLGDVGLGASLSHALR